MHISKLEIFGFKSFAKKETVLFNSGITGIVGPNGCGKTNIVDAIRWVLGEQKTKRLRSSKMEDVIFNGASNVKPLGLCEVYLTIENNIVRDSASANILTTFCVTSYFFNCGNVNLLVIYIFQINYIFIFNYSNFIE